MLKKVLSSLLVSGVIAATVVAPVLAAPVPDRPIPSYTERHLFVDVENSWEPLQCELNLNSKPGLGYILFDANQCGGGLSLARGHFVEPVLEAPSIEPPVLPPPVEPPVLPPPVEPPVLPPPVEPPVEPPS